MARIILPFIYIMMLYFAPLFSVPSSDDFFGETTSSISGRMFLEPTVDCVLAGKYSIQEDCAPRSRTENGYWGYVFLLAVAINIVAIVFGIIGLIPIFSPISSFFTLIAGIISFAPPGLIFAEFHLSEGGIFEILVWLYGLAICALLVLLSSFTKKKYS